MPFTPSHAVVALPFVRTPLLPAAVAVGAMAPDLPLFVRGTPVTYHLTHTNPLVAAGVAAVLLLGWYALLRPAARELLPAAIARRLPAEWDVTGLRVWSAMRETRFPATGRRAADAALAAVIVVSALVGALTHVVWDAFTHEARWGVAVVPVLDQEWGPLLGYKWLQYGSGILGLGVLAVYGLLWWRRRAVSTLHRVLPDAVRVVWLVTLPLILAIAWFVGLAVLGPFRDDFTPAHLGYRVLPPACAVWALVTLALCAVVVLRRRRPTGSPSVSREAPDLQGRGSQ